MKTNFKKKLKRAKIVKKKLAVKKAQLISIRQKQREELKREEQLNKEARALFSASEEVELACEEHSERPVASSFQRQSWQISPSKTNLSPQQLSQNVFNRSAWGVK